MVTNIRETWQARYCLLARKGTYEANFLKICSFIGRVARKNVRYDSGKHILMTLHESQTELGGQLVVLRTIVEFCPRKF